MASLPPRQASQQRRSSPEQNASQQSQSRTSPSPSRKHEEDSQTVFMNKPEEQEHQQAEPAHETLAQSFNGEESNVKKCWICFEDSTEDTPQTSPWRSPCPCALTAHEECLLDWIADMEAPNNRRSARSVAPPKIECPQCKTEIKLARPRNFVVEAVRGVERLGSQLITPGALTVLFGTVYNSSMAWGVHSVYAVFGSDDGFRILRPLILNRVRPPIEFENGTPQEISERMMAVAVNHLVHWRLYIGLPLITPMLILSRTAIADPVLPVLPVLFFATQYATEAQPAPLLDETGFGSWPPSASLAFAVLPYVRSMYNIFYQKMFAAKEKQWLQEIQPRISQTAPDDGAADEDPGADRGRQQELGGMGARDDDENVFEVRIDGGIWDEWEDDTDSDNDEQPMPQAPQEEQPQQEEEQERPQEEQAQPDEAAPAPHVPFRPEDIQAPAPGPQQPANQENQPAAGQAEGGGQRRLSFSPTAIAETVLGALLFPAIAGMSGELLKVALPRAWTTSPTGLTGRLGGRTAARGILQEKWGRSLVGGCLFVVLKDAVMLYVRWKMAQMHRRRSVLDYTGQRRS